MAQKRRSFVQRELRRNLREFASESRWYLLALLATYPSSLVLSRLLGGQNSYLRGFFEGAMLILVLAAIALLFLLHTEGLQQLAGARGEEATHDQLEQARRRGHIYGAVANVELDRADVDSIVITPRGVLAIETKWHFRKVEQRNLHYDLDAARRAAQKTAFGSS